MGSDGLGGLSDQLPELNSAKGLPAFSAAPASTDLLITELLARPEGTVTIIALGPLSNLAAAEAKHPGILRRAKEVVAMAGAFWVPGNITPDAEFNVLQDPESYATVLDATDVTFMPLDVTSKIMLRQSDIERLSTFVNPGAETHLRQQRRLLDGSALCATESPLEASASSTAASASAAQLLGFVSDLWVFLSSQTLNFKQSSGGVAMTLHDGAAVGFALYPNLFTLKRGRVEVDVSHQSLTQSQGGSQGKGKSQSSSRGRTSMDRRVVMQVDEVNGVVGVGVDVEALLGAFVEDVQSLLEGMV